MSSPFPPSPSSVPPFIAAICPLVHRLYVQSPILRLLFLAQSIGSGLSLVVLAFGMLQICTRQPIQLPIGTLLMMLNLCVAMLLANVGALLSALYHLHVPIFRPPSSHCYWLSFTQSDCLMIRAILNVSLFATYMSGACLALERMAGSLLLIRRVQTKRAIAMFLAILQWLLSIFAAIPPNFSSIPSAAIFPHCAQFTPSPTQIRPLFFAILGMQVFVLAIYSILTYHNHFDKQISRELARQNPIILEQIHATEQSLPSAAIIVGLFLASTFLDRNFLMALVNTFFGGHSIVGGNRGGKNGIRRDEMFKIAFWSEFQILAIPLMSLLLVAILQVQIRLQRIAEEDIYERVGGSANSAANVLAVRKVGSALGGGDRIIGREAEEDDRLSDPYEKTSTSTASPSTSISLSDGGGSEGCAMEAKKKKQKRKKGNQDLGQQRH